jgi:hypothetical protein
MWSTLMKTLRWLSSDTRLRELQPGDEVAGHRMTSIGILLRRVVVAAQHGACTVCVGMADDGRSSSSAAPPRVCCVYLVRSDRRVPTDAVVRGAVGIPELARAAERGACAKLTRVQQSWDTYVLMLDKTDLRNTRMVPCDAARRRVAALAMQLHHPARVIQRAWRRAVSDPTRQMCQRRLRRELLELRAGSS